MSIINNICKIDLEYIIKNSNSKMEVLNKLNLSGRGHSYDYLNKRIEKDKLNIDHFNKNRKFKTYELEDILVKNSIYKSPSTLKKRLLKEKILENKCSECGQLPFHNGKELTLQIDHINGDNKDNRLENLRILCPNCHTQTGTYSGKKRDKKYKCKSCGKIIKKNMYSLCGECFPNSEEYKEVVKKRKENQKTKFHIEKPVLEKLLLEMPYEKIGDLYGVTGNSIRKRAKKLGIELPKNRRGYWSKHTMTE